MTMSRSCLAETSDMFPHSEAKPVRLPVAATHGPPVAAAAVDGGVVVADGHTLIPQDVVGGPAAVVPVPAEPIPRCCPQPTITKAQSAITAATQVVDPRRISVSGYHTHLERSWRSPTSATERCRDRDKTPGLDAAIVRSPRMTPLRVPADPIPPTIGSVSEERAQAQTLIKPPDEPAPRSVPWGPLVFGLALLSGLTMVFVVSKTSLASAGFDPYNFGQMGKSIAAGHGFAGFGNLIERRAPLYPAVIGLVYAIFGVHPQLFLVFQCFIFAGTCVLVFDIGRRLFNERTGVIAGVICALNPMLLNYIAYLHLETQLTFLVTLTIWLMVRFYKHPTVGTGVLIGITSALASLTKAVVLFHPAFFAIGIVLAFRAARRRGDKSRTTPWVALVAMLVAMGLTIMPWTIRNYRSSGHFVLISTGTSDAFLRGFIFSRTEFITLQKPPYTDAENESNAYFRSLARAAGNRVAEERLRDRQDPQPRGQAPSARPTRPGRPEDRDRDVHVLVRADQL